MPVVRAQLEQEDYKTEYCDWDFLIEGGVLLNKN